MEVIILKKYLLFVSFICLNLVLHASTKKQSQPDWKLSKCNESASHTAQARKAFYQVVGKEDDFTQEHLDKLALNRLQHRNRTLEGSQTPLINWF